MKKLILLLLLLCVCRREQKITVTFWHVMGGPLGKRLDEMISDFNKLHPEGQVKSVHMGSYDALAQKRLAWEFIKWFLMPENQVRWTEASYYLPMRRSTTELDAFKKFLSENPGYDKIVEQLDFAKTEPKVKEWFTGRIYLNEAMEEAVRLERTPQEALNYAAERLAIEIQ